MADRDRPMHIALNCFKCGKLNQTDQMKFDRHNKHYCIICATKINLCELCGSTKLDDDSMYGQLHYDDW